ncbi:hypothetical protein PIB30_107147, partial [Stylosanthes scabra]|nr:hypothetical protein [Stylosanthes scabra]
FPQKLFIVVEILNSPPLEYPCYVTNKYVVINVVGLVVGGKFGRMDFGCWVGSIEGLDYSSNLDCWYWKKVGHRSYE